MASRLTFIPQLARGILNGPCAAPHPPAPRALRIKMPRPRWIGVAEVDRPGMATGWLAFILPPAAAPLPPAPRRFAIKMPRPQGIGVAAGGNRRRGRGASAGRAADLSAAEWIGCRLFLP